MLGRTRDMQGIHVRGTDHERSFGVSFQQGFYDYGRGVMVACYMKRCPSLNAYRLALIREGYNPS
jgi:hypothetical protein